MSEIVPKDRLIVTTIALVAITVSTVVAGQAPFPMSAPVFGQYPSLIPFGPKHGVADFNGDGREDIAAAFGQAMASIQTLPGGGYGAPNIIASWPGTGGAWVHAAEDFTGDGFADILCSFFFNAAGASTTFVYPGTGSGQFGSWMWVPDLSGFVGDTPECYANHSVPGFTTPGGPPAIVLCARQTTPTALVHVFTLVYQAGFFAVVGSFAVTAPPALGPNAVFQFWRSGDVNGDGLLDLVGTASSPPFAQWDWVVSFGTGSQPFFLPAVLIPTQIQLIANFEVADVNNDGFEDVIARTGGSIPTPVGPTIDIAVYFGHPTTPLSTFQVSAPGIVSSAYNVVEDFDGDGARDLLLSVSPPVPGSTVWGAAFSRGDGQGHFGPALVLQGYPSASSWYAAADENGDGFNDAVGYNANLAPTFVLHNQSKIGPGLPGSGGIVPKTIAGIAIPGNPFYFVGVTNGAPNMPAVLGVSLGLVPAPDVFGNLLDLSPSMLILPTSQSSALPTNAVGNATWTLALPPAPALSGQTIFLEWAVADPGVGSGYSLTPARKVVFW
jgi:hypothetical protein